MRRVVLGAIARTAAVVAATLLLYFFVPVDGFNEHNPAAAWFRLAVVALVFLGAMSFQVRRVAYAKAPLVRAAEGIVQIVVLFVSLFSLLYTAIATSDPLAFTEPLDRLDALYFTTTTLATVGFGDITPVTDLARAVVTVQMLAGLGLLVVVGRAFLFAAKRPRPQA
ncbi:potassium channel family protein [Paenarthrobacter sp. NPDC056912]|uniref:potassium channel family protein n=1 Tax=Paenarthrobacter sp. NPDC056912 TaxID=3345965 RepID=UPI00366E2B60